MMQTKGFQIKIPLGPRTMGIPPHPETVPEMIARRTHAWKRMTDIFLSLGGLILAFPWMVLIALFIKWVSPGPILFRQKRVGKGGKLFDCYKFRTMNPDADTTQHRKYLEKLINGGRRDEQQQAAMTKLRGDSRIIPFGNVLRESGLDELPQLFNVLRGEMSIVGPRPPIPYEVREYQSWHKDRFDVLPGITGLWQVSGKNRLTFNEMIRLDIRYTREVSLLLDVGILLRTPYAVLLQFLDYLRNKKGR